MVPRFANQSLMNLAILVWGLCLQEFVMIVINAVRHRRKSLFPAVNTSRLSWHKRTKNFLNIFKQQILFCLMVLAYHGK
jgi:hypothetical protein